MDVVGATSIHYAPAIGNYVPIFGRRQFEMRSFSEMTLPLDPDGDHAGYHQYERLYDVFMYEGGIGTGPAWSTRVLRGVGQGTTELDFVDGVLVNKHPLVLRTGTAAGDLINVATNRATFLGTFRCSADGEAEDSSKNRLVSNAYNTSTRYMRSDYGTMHTYSKSVLRAEGGDSGRTISFVQCCDGRIVKASVAGCAMNDDAVSRYAYVEIGVSSYERGMASSAIPSLATSTKEAMPIASYIGIPGPGYHFLAWLECGSGQGELLWLNRWNSMIGEVTN